MRSSAATDREVERIRGVLGTLIAWMATSANSPITATEAKKLLEQLDPPGARLRKREP